MSGNWYSKTRKSSGRAYTFPLLLWGTILSCLVGGLFALVGVLYGSHWVGPLACFAAFIGISCQAMRGKRYRTVIIPCIACACGIILGIASGIKLPFMTGMMGVACGIILAVLSDWLCYPAISVATVWAVAAFIAEYDDWMPQSHLDPDNMTLSALMFLGAIAIGLGLTIFVRKVKV